MKQTKAMNIRLGRIPAAKPTRWVVVVLTMFLLHGAVSGGGYLQERESDRLEGLFQWCKKYFLEGKYYEATRKLELLMDYLEPDNREHRRLSAKTLILLGASNERMGKLVAARAYYKRVRGIMDKELPAKAVEDIDFRYLVEYQRVVMDNSRPLMERVIERVARRPAKKRFSPKLALIGLAVVVALTAFVMARKQGPQGPSYGTYTGGNDPDFDTEVLDITWVDISGGAYPMGDLFNEGEADELPVHNVTLDSYRISMFEITFQQYDLYCSITGAARPSDNGLGREFQPVINISWDEAHTFCNWLSKKVGRTITLPSEAQWEVAARFGQTIRYPWGNTPPDCDTVNHCCDLNIFPVGSFPTDITPSGVLDMGGNVSEWCSDWYQPMYYMERENNNPQGPSSSIPENTKVTRGGSWRCPNGFESSSPRISDRSYRSAGPSSSPQVQRFADVGFRIVEVR